MSNRKPNTRRSFSNIVLETGFGWGLLGWLLGTLWNGGDGAMQGAIILGLVGVVIGVVTWRNQEADAPKVPATQLAKGTLIAELMAQGGKRRDLRRADLAVVDLEGADLRGANLSKASLVGTILNGAKLRGTKLWEARLAYTKLAGADLAGADFYKANLFPI